ncbi:MAG: hypothetical protein IIZ73_09605, partial [Ruminococcus sp.]|nr:hypothetical protein [Ruminococcus sp.]
DLVPTNGSLNPVTSNGVFQELKKLKVINENPENHNGIYRGKDLTNVYTIEQIYERVHDGSFEDLYLGDYFTVHLTTDLYTRFTGAEFVAGTTYYEMGGTVVARAWTETQDAEPQEGKVYATKQVVEEDIDLMIASFDYYMNCGVSAKMTDHHIILIPRAGFANTAPIQISGIVGYNESDVHNITLPCYAASIKAALNNHIRTMSVRLPSTITESTPSMAGAGYVGATTAAVTGNVELMFPTENQIFGTKIMGSSYFDIGLEYQKLEVFNFINFTPAGNNPRAMRTFTHIATGNKLYYEVLLWTGQVSSGGAANLRELCPTMVMG